MQAHSDNLPTHLSPLDELMHPNDQVHPISMCAMPIEALDVEAYQSLRQFLQKHGAELDTCDYTAQSRRTGRILVRPTMLTFFHERVRPLAEFEVNYLWMLGRRSLLTIDRFVRLCNGEPFGNLVLNQTLFPTI